MDLLTHIRILIDIADQGSMAGVARSRSLAPSAVTASLRRLEEHVGAKLVLRSTRRLAFTPEGERFLKQCRTVVRDLEEAVELVGGDGPLRGKIRLTSINDFGRARLSGLIDSFLARHPDVHFDLYLGDEVSELIDGGFDLGLRTGPLSDSRLQARLILRAGRSVCAAPSYWKRFGKPALPEDLLKHNCLVLSRRGHPQCVWSFSDGEFGRAIHVSGDRTANDGGLLRTWAIAGAGIVSKSDYDVAADLKAGRLETALDDFKERDVNLYAVHAAGRHPSRRVQAFIDYLAEMLGSTGTG